MSKLKEIYTAVLIGKMPPFEAADFFKQYDKAVTGEDEVEVLPKYVISKIKLYLDGKIDEEQLSDWAAFIVTMEGFVTPHYKDDYDLADMYEPMWLILQHLSTQHLDGLINKKLVKEYIEILKKLP